MIKRPLKPRPWNAKRESFWTKVGTVLLYVFLIILAVASVVGIVFGIEYALWQLYMYVVGTWCDRCSDKVLHPSFWQFFFTLLFVLWVLRILHPSKSTKASE